MTSKLDNPIFRPVLFAILVKRLGGTVTITQRDIDDVAYLTLWESGDRRSGELTFQLQERKAND